MTTPDSLPRHLDAWKRRLTLRRALVRAGRIALGGALVVGTLVAIYAAIPIPTGPFATPQTLAIALGIAALLAAIIPFITTRFTRPQAAQIADLVQNTQGLFVTAEDALRRQKAGETLTKAEEACLERAAETADALHPADIAPMRFGARWAVALAPIMAALAIALTPHAIDQTAIEDQKKLEAALEALEKLPDAAKTRKKPDEALNRGLRRLKSRLKKGELTRREAMEELGDLKSKLRAERRARTERGLRASKAAQNAARELGQSQSTSKLAQQLAAGARTGQSQAQQEKNAERAADAVRDLNKLNREQRQKAADSLERAAKAAEAAGNMEMAQAMNNAAAAAREGNGDQLQQAAGQLQQAMNPQNQGMTQEEMDQLAQALENAQQQLSGGQQTAQNGQPGKGAGDESQIAPGPRDWQAGPGQPGKGAGQRAGTGHSDEEGEAKEITDGHQDADRFSDKVPEEAQADYKELYEAMLLGGDGRIGTRVKGERNKEGRVDSLRGGQQAPRDERAQRVMERLPVEYAREVDEAIGEETIPPAYRDAVKDYFDAEGSDGP